MKRRWMKRSSNRVSSSSHGDIVKLYSEDMVSMIEIASRYGVTRMAVWKILKKCGVDTSKAAANVATKCEWCGEGFKLLRCYYRSRLHHFCKPEHYYKWLNRSITPYIKHRYSLKIARKIVEEHFFIEPGQVVHHENRDQTDNSLSNLRVFDSQGDHTRYHRGFDAKPVWDGRQPTPC